MRAMTRTAAEDEVIVELPAHPRSGQIARAAVDDLADTLRPDTMAKLRLLVTEMVVAALTPDQTGPLRLTVRARAGAVRAELAPAAATEELVEPLRPRRWSLFLVNRIADRWGAGDSLWFEVDGPER
jgi:hypothetical protein